MNCKPGDLAIVVKGGLDNANVGRIVEVLTAHSAGIWWVQVMGAPALNLIDRPVQKGLIEDDRLRPIRDPGDDARDQTLDWLPVPTKEMA